MNTIIKFFIPHLETSNLNFQIKKQLPYILVITLVLCIVFLLLIPVSMINENGKIATITYIFFALSIIQLVALILIRTEKFLSAAWLNTLSILVSGVCVLFFMATGKLIYEAYRPLAFIAIMSIANVLVSLDKKQIILMFLGSLTGWFTAFAVIYSSYFVTDLTLTIAVMITGVLGILFSNIVLLFVNKLSKDLLATAESETAIAHNALGNITNLMNEAREGMAIGERLLSASQEMQHSVLQVEEIGNTIKKTIKILLQESDSFSKTSSRVIDGTQSVKSNFNEQNAAVTETSAAITQISANLENISGIAQKRREMLNSMDTTGASQLDLLKKLVLAFDSVRSSSEGSSVFVNTVQDVASQTQLLSMNASIEAARAGSSGKGFAVIAQEIRTLSLETDKTAITIRDILEQNKKTIAETDRTMQDFSVFITKSTEELQQLLLAIDEILRGITEMDTGTREVTKAMQNIVDTTQDSADKIKSVANEVDLQKEGFTRIESVSQELASDIENLAHSVTIIRKASDLIAQTGRENTEQVRKLQIDTTQNVG
ncbi:MAG TPA: methyl-accepting chemotaxis protein [Treponemataceae bacterium]|nr:methyl-accepting chemotaxis protein [Treponemataceae bacterium]